MRSIVAALCFALLGIGSAQAQTASVIPLQGELSLNQGQGFQPVDSRIGANVGDSLIVGPGGSAAVVYQDGCQVTVQPGSVTTIAPLSPCASGSLAQEQHPEYHPEYHDWLIPALTGAAITGLVILGIEERRHHVQVISPVSP